MDFINKIRKIEHSMFSIKIDKMKFFFIGIICIISYQSIYAQETTTHYDFIYPDRGSLVAAGWDFIAKDPFYAGGGSRNTEYTNGVTKTISYDQTIHPGVIRIPDDEGDLWQNFNNTRNSIFRTLPLNWTSIRLKIASFNPTQNTQQAGLLVYEDDDNYVQVARDFGNENHISTVREIGGKADVINSIGEVATSNIYLRLDRDQATEIITSYYSLDGSSWSLRTNVFQVIHNPRLAIVVGASPDGFPNADIAWAEVITKPFPPLSDELRAYPHSIVFNARVGQDLTTTRSINLFTTLEKSLDWAYSANVSWLTPSSTSGQTEAILKVGVNTNGLLVGVYNGTITLHSAHSTIADVKIAVSLVVNPVIPVEATTWKDGIDAAMSVSVDDGLTSGFVELQNNGFKGTFESNAYGPPSTYTDYYYAGMELAAHLANHICGVSTEYMLRNNEIAPNIQGICDLTPQPCKDLITLTWPCGATNYMMESVASEFFLSARGYNINQLEDATPDNFMNLKGYNSHENTPLPPNDLKTVVDLAIQQHKWFNLVLHWSTLDDGAIAYAKGKNIWVAPIGTVTKYILQRDRIILTNYTSNSSYILFNASRLAVSSPGSKDFELAFGQNDLTTLQIDIDDDKSIDNVKINGINNPFQLKYIGGNKVLLTNVMLKPNVTTPVQINFSSCTASIPGVSVSASATTVCSGTNVTFTALPVNGGTQPSYQWQVNGKNAGNNSLSFTYRPSNNDVVRCQLISNSNCTLTTPATSNSVNMIVNPTLAANLIKGKIDPIVPAQGVAYTVTTDNTPSATYLWSYSGTGATLSSATGNAITINYASTATSGTLTVVETTLSGCATTNTLVIFTIENPDQVLWKGTVSNDWNDKYNWLPNTVPTSSIDAVIHYTAPNFPHVTSEMASPAVCNNLLINSGGSVTIDAGKALTVLGTLTNNTSPGLIIKSDVNGTGSLICNGIITGTGTADVQRYIAGYTGYVSGLQAVHGWNLLSSPVGTLNISGSAFMPGIMDDLYSWNEPANQWFNYKNGNPTLLEPGKGYLIANEANATKTFIGTLNNTDVLVSGLTNTGSLFYKGWYLLGNPFSSALAWNKSGGSWDLSGIDANCQIWNEANASYTTIIANGIIPAMNGFMVHTTGSGSLTIPLSARLHNSLAWYKKEQQNSDLILLVARDIEGLTAQESIIRFDAGATEGYDSEFDSYFIGGYAPMFYSVAGNESYALNTLPKMTDNLEIPFSFIKNNSSNFNIELTKNVPDAVVYLIDKKTGEIQNLNENPVYNFNSSDGDQADRFTIRFSTTFLGVDPPSARSNFSVWYNKGDIHFSALPEKVISMSLIDMTGRELLILGKPETDKVSVGQQLAIGYYMLRIRMTDKVVVRKLFIN